MTNAQRNKLNKCQDSGFNLYRFSFSGELICFYAVSGKVLNVRIYGSNGVQKNLDTVKFNYSLNGTEKPL